jgi:hypothetical protein
VNDVKEICALALEVPPPPLPDAAQVLASARRSAARRTAVAAVGGSGVALTAVAATAAALLAPAPAGGLAAARPPQQSTAARPVEVPALPPAAPDETYTKGYGDRVLALLTAATPAGYTASRPYPDEPTSAWTLHERPGPGYAMLTYALVSAGSGQGELTAFVHADGKPVPTGDPCSAGVIADLRARQGDGAGTCQAVTIGGVPIQVVTTHDAERGEVVTATRFVRGGVVQVIAAQGTPVYVSGDPHPSDAPKGGSRSVPPHQPALASQPFTAQALATLAADPALVPVP